MKVYPYQSFYSNSQRNFLEKEFIPFDNIINAQPLLREEPLHLQLLERHKDEKDAYWGLVSWKWREKIHSSGEFFVQWVYDNPGYDLYFIDPHFSDAAVYKNSFVNGEINHPGMMPFINGLLKDLNTSFDMQNYGFHPDIFSTCTYWIGNHKFWKRWRKFWDKCLRIINETPEYKNYVFGLSQKLHLGNRITNYSFVHERLISIFLILDSNIKFIHYPYDSKVFFHKTCQEFSNKGNGPEVFYKLMYLLNKKYNYCGSNKVIHMSEEEFGYASNTRFY